MAQASVASESVGIAAPVAEFIRMMGMWWADLVSSMREHAERPESRMH